MTSEEFEQQVARIAAVLEGAGATVQWNERIPDPDNPSQARQIDVTVRRDSTLTILECRHHARPQDVQWIEELYGRRDSLSADAIIGVSSSGFTANAWIKAKRLGVFLRDLQKLSDMTKMALFRLMVYLADTPDDPLHSQVQALATQSAEQRLVVLLNLSARFSA